MRSKILNIKSKKGVTEKGNSLANELNAVRTIVNFLLKLLKRRSLSEVALSSNFPNKLSERHSAMCDCRLKAGPRALIATIALFFLLSVATPQAVAREFSVGVFPPIIQIDAISPSIITSPIQIENLSEESASLSIQLMQFLPSAKSNGEIEFVNQPDATHKKMFGYTKIKEGSTVRNRIELAPKQKKNLTLQIDLPEGSVASDYYFSIVFISNDSSSEEKSQTVSVGAVAANVLLSVGEKDLPVGKIAEFSAPFFVTKGPVQFKTRIENQSPYFISTEGNVVIKNIFGQIIGNLELIPANILAKSTRLLTNDEGLPPTFDDPRIVWKEKFLLGLYTADLTVSLSEQGPILRDRITFLAVPIEIIVGELIAVVIIIIVYRRVRKRMSDEL